MTNQQIIEAFLKKNVALYDLELVSQPNKFTAKRALYRAAIDRSDFGNLVSSSWCDTIDEAFAELVQELRRELQRNGEKL